MNTLPQLRSGSLAGATHLQLSEGLETFPHEILELSESLRVLDLSGNRLTSLPPDFSRLGNLEILFCSENQFEILPEVLGQCPRLEMVGFKSNRLRTIPSLSLPDQLRWLILTDNQLEELPASLGERPRLQKLMLAGNRLRSIPSTLCGHPKLELLRIAANAMDHLPEWLFELPRLAWLATSGNPCSWNVSPRTGALIEWASLRLGPVLGRGASGETLQATTVSGSLAVKVFKAKTTSDGTPQDEMATFLAAGTHPHLARVLGEVVGHPQGRHALAMELLPAGSVTVGNPPDFQSCTRDTYAPHTTFSAESVIQVSRAIASVCSHLADRGISHGDLYAHNILVTPTERVYLTDFGAANRWDPTDRIQRRRWEGLEARAYGCLLDDLLTRTDPSHAPSVPLAALRDACLDPNPRQRPAMEAWKIG